MPIPRGAIRPASGAESRFNSLVFGDLGSDRESGRLLAGISALSFFGLWAIFGEEIVSASLGEVTGVSVVFGVHSVFTLSLLAWALLRRGGARHRNDYWILTGSAAFTMVRPTSTELSDILPYRRSCLLIRCIRSLR